MAEETLGGIHIRGKLRICGNLVIDSVVCQSRLTVDGDVVVEGDVIIQDQSARQVQDDESGSGEVPKTHVKCRNSVYNKADNIRRFPVPDDKVQWPVDFPDYIPMYYTAAVVLASPVWADVDVRKESPVAPISWNSLCGKVDRTSHMGQYQVVDGVPRNPVGRSGVCGRGWLGRWGPNHAADPIVTRWKRDENNKIVRDKKSRKPVLQFVSILRGDTHEWAIPGGMVDAGEEVSLTLVREFCEEAMDSTKETDTDRTAMEKTIRKSFKKGLEIYRGYVDDPRNTDNAWMETVAVNFHDETGTNMGKFHLHAGDDAVGVRWMDISSELQLYASHAHFVQQAVRKHNAHW